MVQIPYDPHDKGYFNISELILEKMDFLKEKLTFSFKTIDEARINVQLDDVIAYHFKMQPKKLTWLRVDGDGGSYGFDIALHLKNPEINNYMILYLFEDQEHTEVLFRGLAKRIYVEMV